MDSLKDLDFTMHGPQKQIERKILPYSKKVICSSMKVSVMLLTYNHEKYIAQAIESALMQETAFNYEIVIGEDCSTDRTREITIEYQKKHPDKIRLLLPEKNLGIHANEIQVYSACKGEYLAFLDGDDYWIDRKKLQKQIDFLEDNSKFSMCFTGARIINEEGELLCENRVPEKYRRSLSQRDILSGYVPPTLTVMSRRSHIQFPKCYYKMINTDFLECAMITEYGNAGYLPEVTSCHRLHKGGIWSMKDEEYYTLHNLKTREALLEHFGYRYRDILIPQVHYYFTKQIRQHSQNNALGKLFLTYLRFIKFLICNEPKFLLSKTLKKFWQIPFRWLHRVHSKQ